MGSRKHNWEGPERGGKRDGKWRNSISNKTTFFKASIPQEELVVMSVESCILGSELFIAG